MIETKTLLIIGAGASVPYGYPTGKQLKDDLSDPIKLNSLADRYNFKVDKIGLQLFAQHFKASQLNSIDAFLAKRGDDHIGRQPAGSGYQQTFGTYGECGKLAIAGRLIESEITKKLLEPEGDIKPERDHWLQYLWNLMSDVPKTEFEKNQLKIVSFNYDRVIEQYFQTAIEHTYTSSISSDEATELRKSIEIVHVYGNLQDLENRAYGEKSCDITAVSNCIRIIPEAREHDEQFDKARQMVGWADKICFIGFSFDPINVRRLGFPDHKLFNKTIYFTQFGLTVNEAKAAKKLLGEESFSSHIDNNGEFTNLKTLDYIRHQGVFLSL